jgi:hypothetical protein
MKKLLEFYKFRRVMPRDAIAASRKAKRKALKNILKEKKTYSALTAAALSVYYIFKRIGHSITYTQAVYMTFVIGTVILILIAGSSVAALSAISALHKTNTLPVSQNNLPEPDTGLHNDPVKQTLAYKVTITPFEADAQDRAKAQQVARTARDSLNVKFGKTGAHIAPRGTADETPYLLTGVIITVGKNKMASIKLIDTDSSQVLFINTVPLDDAAAIQTSINEIIGRVK